jgi:lipopolysaccharide heptosyltransferase II
MKKREKNVLVILIAGIGDLIMASKALRALGHGYQDGCLHLLTSTEAATLARNYPYVDHVWSLPLRELRREKSQISGILKTLLQLRKTRFDKAVNLYRVVSRRGALRMGLLFRLLKVRAKVGHDSKGLGLFLDKKAPVEIFQKRHFVDAMTDIAVLAGGVPDEQGIEVFWDKACERKWDYLFSLQNERPRLKIGINPGADNPLKRWNPDHYAFVAQQILERYHAEVFLLGGPGEEKIAAEIEERIRKRIINLSGQLSLNDLVYIISRLDLLVTNDSGPMHIAAALKTPLVAVFGPEDPTYTRPYTSPDVYRIVYRELDCRPCQKQRCDQPQCLELVRPEEVLQKCVELLK